MKGFLKVISLMLVCFFLQGCKLPSKTYSQLEASDASAEQGSVGGSLKDTCSFRMVGNDLVSTCTQDTKDRWGVLSVFENVNKVCQGLPVDNTNGATSCGDNGQIGKARLVKGTVFKKSPHKELCDQCTLAHNQTAMVCRCFDPDGLESRSEGNAYLTVLENYNRCKPGSLSITADHRLSCGDRVGWKTKSTPPGFNFQWSETPENPNRGTACFSKNMNVRLASGKQKPIANLNWSDEILGFKTPLKSPHDVEFTETYFIVHMHQGSGQEEAYRLTTESGGILELTANHIIFVQQDSDGGPRDLVAEDIKIGDLLFMVQKNGTIKKDRIINKENIIMEASYAPLVGDSGTLVVNNFMVSSHMTKMPPDKTPLRNSHQEIFEQFQQGGLGEISLPIQSPLDATKAYIIAKKVAVKMGIEGYVKTFGEGPIPWLKEVPQSLLPADLPGSLLPK